MNGNGSGRQPPAFEYRIGRIRGIAWKNHSEQHGAWYSVNITRSYKDGGGNWKTATSYGRDDLLVVAEVARQMFLWVADQQTGNGAPAPSANGNGHQPPAATTTSEEPIPF